VTEHCAHGGIVVIHNAVALNSIYSRYCIYSHNDLKYHNRYN